MNPLLTLAIPSFNRPEQLGRLLASIDTQSPLVEILVAEDDAPRRQEVREVVAQYSRNSKLHIDYRENNRNLGFDGNLRSMIEAARGQWIMFLGDDDLLIPGRLDGFLSFLGGLNDEKYVLRSYQVTHDKGQVETFQYLPESTRIESGQDSVAWLFKRSVTLTGFCIDRQSCLQYATALLDGTLLYQVYLMSMVCLQYPSVYYHVPVAEMTPTYRDDVHMFGSSEAERHRFTPGSVTTQNSLNFTKAYFEVARFIDTRSGSSLYSAISLELSKYSYPFLSIQRKRGIRTFLQYCRALQEETSLGGTLYFHIYKWGLVLLGERVCDALVRLLKRFIGHAPNF